MNCWLSFVFDQLVLFTVDYDTHKTDATMSTHKRTKNKIRIRIRDMKPDRMCTLSTTTHITSDLIFKAFFFVCLKSLKREKDEMKEKNWRFVYCQPK